MVNIEKFSAQRNVHVTGIPERRDEEPESMVRELFTKKLKVEFAEKDIESAARIGVRGDMPRDIVVKFANLKDKNSCLKNSHLLEGTPYGVKDAVL